MESAINSPRDEQSEAGQTSVSSSDDQFQSCQSTFESADEQSESSQSTKYVKRSNKSSKMPQAQPELKKWLEKRVLVEINAGRKINGILRGYDVFMNLVIEDGFEEREGGEKVPVKMACIRGNSVVSIEALERISDK